MARGPTPIQTLADRVAALQFDQHVLKAGFFGDDASPITRRSALERLFPTIDGHIGRGGRLTNITRHVLGLYHGRPRGRLFRRILSEDGQRPKAGIEVLHKAIAAAEGNGAIELASAAE